MVPNDNRAGAVMRLMMALTLAIGPIGFAGMLCVFSYLAPTMLEATKVTPQWIPFGLAAFGVGGIIASGKLFDRMQFRAMGLILAWSMAVLLFFPFVAGSLWSVLLSMGMVGAMVSLTAALQIRLMDIAHHAPNLAAASNHATFNLAYARGRALAGPRLLPGLGGPAPGISAQPQRRSAWSG